MSCSPLGSSMSKEGFLESLRKLSDEQGSALWRLWLEMGCINGSSGSYRSRVVHECIREKFSAMISEEESHKSALISRIEDHYRRLLQLSSELSLPVEEPPEDLSLIQLEKALRDLVEDLKMKKKLIIEEIQSFQSKDESLASSLDEKPYPMNLSRIPGQSEREKLLKHTQELAELKAKRLLHFKEMKVAIHSLMEDLSTEPSNSFERAIVCEADTSFTPLSKSRLSAVEQVLQTLLHQKEHNKQMAALMREKISNIVQRLELDVEETDCFLRQNGGFSPNELKELQFRLDELELLKAQHTERFVVAARKELEEWWDRCFYTEKQRSLFSPYYSHDYTEELLLKHEEQIMDIKKYFHQNESLFQMVEQRQGLWEKKLELERKAKDPNRFNCKSTEFLKEERDRKRVEKQLPKIEKSLEDAMEDYRIDNGEEFLVGGIPYLTYMELQIKEHEDNLQREKIEKAQAKKQLVIRESRYGSTPAKLNSTKRKAPHTVDVNISKKQRTDVTRGTINSTRSSTRSTLTRSISTRSTLRPSSNRSRYGPDSSILTGTGEFKMALRSLDDENPFLNPSGINANSTLQSDFTPRNYRKNPKTTALTTGGRAMTRRSRSAVVLSSKKSPNITAKKSLFKPSGLITNTTSGRLLVAPSSSSSLKTPISRTRRKL